MIEKKGVIVEDSPDEYFFLKEATDSHRRDHIEPTLSVCVHPFLDRIWNFSKRVTVTLSSYYITAKLLKKTTYVQTVEENEVCCRKKH